MPEISFEVAHTQAHREGAALCWARLSPITSERNTLEEDNTVIYTGAILSVLYSKRDVAENTSSSGMIQEK